MTSVLVLQKFTAEEKRQVAETGRAPEYEIFMSIADRVGWDLRGQPVFLRTPEGEEILKKELRTLPGRNALGDLVEVQREIEEPIVDDHLPIITKLFAEWLTKNRHRRWMNG